MRDNFYPFLIFFTLKKKIKFQYNTYFVHSRKRTRDINKIFKIYYYKRIWFNINSIKCFAILIRNVSHNSIKVSRDIHMSLGRWTTVLNIEKNENEICFPQHVHRGRHKMELLSCQRVKNTSNFDQSLVRQEYSLFHRMVARFSAAATRNIVHGFHREHQTCTCVMPLPQFSCLWNSHRHGDGHLGRTV